MKETKVRFNKDIKRKDKKKLTRMLMSDLGVREVIFNDNATIVITEDFTEQGSKGVSKRDSVDYYDPFLGFCAAYVLAKANENEKAHYVKDRIKFAREEDGVKLISKYRPTTYAVGVANGRMYNIPIVLQMEGSVMSI